MWLAENGDRIRRTHLSVENVINFAVKEVNKLVYALHENNYYLLRMTYL